MPTRTINLKLVLGKKEATTELRRALWTTHWRINQAVGRIERILLLCRGASYRTIGVNGEEKEVTQSEVEHQALQMAREAQKRNKSIVGSDEEVLKALRILYEQIVPSCVLDDKGNPLKGDAQSIGSGYAGPLLDPDTCKFEEDDEKATCGPFAETASKQFSKLPDWVIEVSKNDFCNDDKESFLRFKNASGVETFYRIDIDAATSWYISDEMQDTIKNNKAFNKDGWKKKKEKNDTSWAVDFAHKQLELADDPRITIRKELWEKLGLLPLDNLYFNKNEVGNLWNRLAMRLAVAHLLSWESWNHSTKKEYEKAKKKFDDLAYEYAGLKDKLKILHEYEKARHQTLKLVAFADDDRQYKIGARAIRAWDSVRTQWQKEGNTVDTRKKILQDIQTKKRGKFGDPDLFIWLAQDGHEGLWKDDDALTPLVKLNVSQRLLEKRKAYSLMTFADARNHPRWAMFEAPGGSNLRNYELNTDNKGLCLVLPLLQDVENDGLAEKGFTIRLAPSGQLSNVEIMKNDKKVALKYRSAHQDFKGALGGAEVLFDRHYLEHTGRSDMAIEYGEVGPVWFKLTLDVQSKAPNDWLDGKGKVATPSEVYHFRTALSNKSKHEAKLQPGLRVLSVDLGLRTFASCSVFELVEGKPKNGLFFPAADGRDENAVNKLWARHERSFKLALPGEDPTKQEKIARAAAMSEIRTLRLDIRRLKDILRLGIVEDEEKRNDLIKALEESLSSETADSALTLDDLSGLDDKKYRSTQELWQQRCQQYYNEAEKKISERFSQWRTHTKPKSSSWQDWRDRRSYHGGKSIWMIEYLDSIRKLIMNWNLRGRSYGQVNRQDKKQFGTIASHLLHHINNLKEDRTKSGADMIIQAARGYIPSKDGVGWIEKFEPCRVILFEELARYRFKVDRPRRENSQLMKWNHREIVSEAKMQAEIYGMIIETTAAGFSSRYLASSGAPGVRSRYLNDEDFSGGLPKDYLVYELEWMIDHSSSMSKEEKKEVLHKKIMPGMWVPWTGGEMFASMKDNKSINFIHADINAAQNLQRRFWNRCRDAYRITCRQVDHENGDRYSLENQPGPRLLGALQQLENGDKEFYLEMEADNNHFIMVEAGKKKTRASEDEQDVGEDDFAEALAEIEENDESGGKRETFYRDPSGMIFDSRHWIPSKHYWFEVKKRVWEKMEKPLILYQEKDDGLQF